MNRRTRNRIIRNIYSASINSDISKVSRESFETLRKADSEGLLFVNGCPLPGEYKEFVSTTSAVTFKKILAIVTKESNDPIFKYIEMLESGILTLNDLSGDYVSPIECFQEKINFTRQFSSGRQAISYMFKLAQSLVTYSQKDIVYRVMVNKGRTKERCFLDMDCVECEYNYQTKKLIVNWPDDNQPTIAQQRKIMNTEKIYEQLLPAEILKAFQEQGDLSNTSRKDITVICRFFLPGTGFEWFMYEYIPEDRLFYGFANIDDPQMAECGAISLDELMDTPTPLGNHVERDILYKPENLMTVIRRTQGSEDYVETDEVEEVDSDYPEHDDY